MCDCWNSWWLKKRILEEKKEKKIQKKSPCGTFRFGPAIWGGYWNGFKNGFCNQMIR